jgi:serine protease Do
MFYQDLRSRLASTLVIVVLLAACSAHSNPAAAANPAAPAAAPTPAAAPAPTPVRGLPDFTGLVESVGAAVVNVAVVEKARNNARVNPFGDDDPFGDFFRQFQNVPQRNVPINGEGSGFIVSPDGYILTNAHVVDNATKITVNLTDRREFVAKLIGVDERTDVAVIKIDAKNLPTVRIGDPGRLKPGEWVIAIGSPFGFQNSVTAGVVSAVARDLNEDSSKYVPFIQTDVAVNPGNSGGPLFNMNGEVVGINSQIYSNNGQYAGLSFAIPIDIANGVREQLIKTGHVSRGRIGVLIQEVSALLADNYGLDRPRGAVITTVESGGPADKAGLKPEDVILSVNGKTIEHSNQVPALITALRPGQTVDLEVWRGKSSKHFTVTVDEAKDTNTVASSGEHSGGDAIDQIGLTVRELSSSEQQQLDVKGGLMIVDSDGAAAEAGLRGGDVVLGANRTRVNTVSELRAAVRGATRSVSLVVQRNHVQTIVTIRLP